MLPDSPRLWIIGEKIVRKFSPHPSLPREWSCCLHFGQDDCPSLYSREWESGGAHALDPAPRSSASVHTGQDSGLAIWQRHGCTTLGTGRDTGR